MTTFGATLRANRREIRFAIFVALLVAQFLIGFLASGIPVSPQEAEDLRREIPQNPSVFDIFANNVRVSSPEFIPAIGLGWMALVTFVTGLVFSALGPTGSIGVPGPIAWLVVAGTPFFWLEFIAYSLASATGTMLLLTILFDRPNLLHEASRALTTAPVYALILWNAAVNELSNGFVVILLGWVPLVIVGLIVTAIYTSRYGPRLTFRDWSILIGMTLLLTIFPPVYVFLVLFYLLSKIWRHRVGARFQPADQTTIGLS